MQLEDLSEYQTISESMDFLQRHPRIIDAAIHLVEEDEGKEKSERPSRVLGGTGKATGLLYLMAVSGSDSEAYRDALRSGTPPTEELLDFGRFEEARKFWVLMSGETKYGKVVSQAMSLAVQASGRGGYSSNVVIACKAWAKFLEGELDKTPPEELLPEYGPENLNGIRFVVENVALEGIDLGERPEEDEGADPPAPTPDEIAAAKAELDKEKMNGHPIPQRKIVH